MPPIGFVILINPRSPLEQSERLIRTLNRMFDYPPIACHQDFGQNPQELRDLTPNVRVVRPHVATGWGVFGCVEATISCLQQLYPASHDGPEWFVYLSGADYPIKCADRILSDLQASTYDGHIEHQRITGADLSHYPYNPDYPRGYKSATWLKQCHNRYCSLRLDVRGINRYLRPSSRTFWLESPIFTTGRLPFGPDFNCYCGEVWYCANHRCARRLIDFFQSKPKVNAHYRKSRVPEESYPHTVLANDESLHLSQDYLRYIDWTGGGSNPKVLTIDDLPFLLETKAHFARKFDIIVDTSILDELDRLIK